MNCTNGHLSIEFYLSTVISLFTCSLFIMYSVFLLFPLVMFVVFLSLFFYVIVLSRLSRVFITY